MLPHRSSLPSALILLFGFCAASSVGCTAEERASLDATMSSDGYALFSVENDTEQDNRVSVVVKDADPGATYVLIYAGDAPVNTGWFLFDPGATSPCTGSSLEKRCDIPGYGYLVDVVKAPPDGSEITLSDRNRCHECSWDRDQSNWTGHWAVMRVERTERSHRLSFAVVAKHDDSFAHEPEIRQLQ